MNIIAIVIVWLIMIALIAYYLKNSHGGRQLKIVLIAFLLFGCSRLSFENPKDKEIKEIKEIKETKVEKKESHKPKTIVKQAICIKNKPKCERVGLTLLDSYGHHFRITGCKEKVDKINTKSIIDAIRILVN